MQRHKQAHADTIQTQTNIVIHNQTCILYTVLKSAHIHTLPRTRSHSVESEIQVDAGVFSFFGSQQGVRGVEKVKTRLSKHSYIHSRHEQGRGSLWLGPEPQAPGHAGSLTRGKRSLWWSAKGTEGLMRGKGEAQLFYFPHDIIIFPFKTQSESLLVTLSELFLTMPSWSP